MYVAALLFPFLGRKAALSVLVMVLSNSGCFCSGDDEGDIVDISE